jgi:lipopolysaccharide exporter
VTQSLLDKSMRGMRWSVLSTAVNVVFQIFFMAVMARLLDPGAFGLMAMAMVTVRVANYFAQLGIGPAIVQKKLLDDADIRVAFTLSVALGFAAAGVIYAIAPLVGEWLGHHQLVDIVRLLSLAFILGGLSTVSVYLLRRRLRFKAIALVETFSYVLGYGACGVVLALIGAGVWSLVGAVLCQNLITLVLGYLLTHHPVVPVFDRQAIRHFYDFGSRYSLIGFLEFVGSNLDTVVIGRFLGDIATGIYNRAFMLTNLPVQHMVNSITKVMFPILSETQHDRYKIGQAYLVFLFLIGSLTGAICFGMIPAAGDLVLTMLGDKWKGATPVLQVLAVAVPFVFLSHIAGIILDALGMLRPKLAIQSASIAVLAVMMYFLSAIGLTGFALAVVISEIFKSLCYFWVMRTVFELPYPALSRILAYVIAISGLTMAAIWAAAKAAELGGLPYWGALIMEITAGGASLLVLFLMAWSGLGHLQMYQRINERFPALLRLSSSIRFF